MKTFLYAFLFFCFTSVNAQIASLQEVESFWKSNIETIINNQKTEIINHTLFPLEGSWGYEIGLPQAPNEWTKEQYSSNLGNIFTKEAIKALQAKTIHDLVHHKNKAGELEFIMNLNFQKNNTMTMAILYFKKQNNTWFLYSIEFIS